MSALCNGNPVVDSLAQSRGLHYGDGVFRTILVHNGELVDAARQWTKLAEDALALDLQPPPQELLSEEARLLIANGSSGVVKVVLTRSASGRGYAPISRDCDRWMFCSAAPRYPETHWIRGVRIMRSPVQLGTQPLLAGIKHLNRLEQVLASRAWPAGIDEAVLCDDFGLPVCGTRSNLFWVQAGTVYTPALDRCGVAGMMRQRLLDLMSSQGLPVQVGGAPWSELADAEEVFLSNSLIGIWPVCEMDGRVLPAPGELTHRMMELLAHPRLS